MTAKLDPRVDMFVDAAPAFAQPVLRHLRGLVHASCGEVEETIKWRMPFFLYRGRIVCAMMAFKAHCRFHLWGPEMKEILRAAGFDEKDSSGSIGLISRLDDLPEEKALRGLLRQAFKIAAEERPAGAGNVLPGGAKRGKRGPAKAVKTPEDLTVELGKRDGAVATFEALSPSCRKEYVEWIEGAKRAETRARRVSKAVGWIAEGKRRNWKYEAS